MLYTAHVVMHIQYVNHHVTTTSLLNLCKLGYVHFGDDLAIVSTWVGCCGCHCCREIDLVYSWYWYVLLVCDFDVVWLILSKVP